MRQTLSFWASRFLEELAEEQRFSPHTVGAYRRDLQRFLDTQGVAGHPPDDKTLSSDRFQNHLATLAVEGLANRSIARAAASLRSFLSFLHRRGITRYNWSERVPGVKFAPALPGFVGETRIRAWLESLPGRTRWELRDRCLVIVLYGTGARLSELVGLNWGDLDSAAGTLRLFGKRSRERIVPAGEYVMAALLELRRRSPGEATADTQPVFVNRKGERITGRSVARILRRSFARAVGGTISPHKLRHTFATHMLNNGADLMSLKEMLGHSNVVTTQIYTHTTPQSLARVYRATFPGDRAVPGEKGLAH